MKSPAFEPQPLHIIFNTNIPTNGAKLTEIKIMGVSTPYATTRDIKDPYKRDEWGNVLTLNKIWHDIKVVWCDGN